MRHAGRVVCSSAVAALAVTCVAGVGQAQSGRKGVWDGVYSKAQATRGHVAYDKHCAGCHGNQLEGLGLGNGPALQGDRFVETWEGNLFALFDMMRSPMPRAEDVNVPDGDVLDTLAFILERNGMPAGADDLTPEALTRINFVGKNGPTDVRDMALGRAMGCLEMAPDKSWKLTRATTVSKSRDGMASSEGELASMKSEPLGTNTFTLLDVYPPPDEHKGHKMEAKGILIKKTNSLNVTSIQMVDSTCGQ